MYVYLKSFSIQDRIPEFVLITVRRLLRTDKEVDSGRLCCAQGRNPQLETRNLLSFSFSLPPFLFPSPVFLSFFFQIYIHLFCIILFTYIVCLLYVSHNTGHWSQAVNKSRRGIWFPFPYRAGRKLQETLTKYSHKWIYSYNFTIMKARLLEI